MLNDDESVKFREMILDLIAMAEEKRDTLRGTVARIDQESSKTPEQEDMLKKEKEDAQRELGKIEEHLLRLSGGGPG